MTVFDSALKIIYGALEASPRRLQGLDFSTLVAINIVGGKQRDFGPLDRPSAPSAGTFPNIATQLVSLVLKLPSDSRTHAAQVHQAK